MPSKFYGKKKLTYRKRKNGYRTRWKKKRYSKNAISSLKLFSPTLVPDVLYTKLKYNETINMSNISGYGAYTFALNGMYDPNISGTGQQPMGFDQWMVFYNKYEVLKSAIFVQVIPPDSNPAQIIVYPSTTSTPVVNAQDANEQPYAKKVSFSGGQTVMTAKLRNYITIKKMEGINNPDQINFSGTVSSNPGSLRYWQLILQSYSATDIDDIYVDVTITYYVRFYKRNALAGS